MHEDQNDRLGELEKKLYARDPEAVPERRYGILHPLKQNVESTWGSTTLDRGQSQSKKRLTGFKVFFIISFIFFVLAAAAVWFSVYKGAVFVSSNNVEVSILGNSFTNGGEALSLEINLVNKNTVELLDSVLIIEYPSGTTTLGGETLDRERRELGVFGSGKSRSEVLLPVLYGEQNTVREIVISFEYSLADSQTRFVKKEIYPVTINTSPTSLIVDGPENVSVNQPFTLTIKNTVAEKGSLANAYVRVEYPNGFVFQSANPKPIAGNNVWSLGDLLSGSYRSISLQGRLDGVSGDEKAFRVYVGSSKTNDSPKIDVVYSSSLHKMVLQEPFLSGAIAIDNATGTDTLIVQNGEAVSGRIDWINNSPIAIASPVLRLRIEGTALDEQSIQANNAFYDSLDREIVWEGDAFLEGTTTLAPFEKGSFSFSFKTLETESITEDIVLSVSVGGTFPDRDYEVQTLETIEEKTIRFSSRLQFVNQATYSIGAFTNSGPFPPQTAKKTTYTITWSVKPSENMLEQAQVTATLPPNIVWEGKISPDNGKLIYNPDTKTIIWNIGTIEKARPSLAGQITTAFQVSAVPTKSMVGKEFLLINKATYSAVDSVTKALLSVERPENTTRLFTDPVYSPGKENVLP